ncbi:MAG: L-rhamnose isomerase [Anaerolineae bacterium]|nr:L-rhamnose isomerase [Anaerolineae bacterium]
MLLALLEPTAMLRELEMAGDLTGRLALLMEVKGLPFTAVWDFSCLQQNVPIGYAFMDDIRTYKRNVLPYR